MKASLVEVGEPEAPAKKIAYCLSEMSWSFAFLFLLAACPERFTKEETAAGLGFCLNDMPGFFAQAKEALDS
ncbi:MAG: hypothetical protein U1G05_02995 [Kiritimatiellia bacterium]